MLKEQITMAVSVNSPDIYEQHISLIPRYSRRGRPSITPSKGKAITQRAVRVRCDGQDRARERVERNEVCTHLLRVYATLL